MRISVGKVGASALGATSSELGTRAWPLTS